MNKNETFSTLRATALLFAFCLLFTLTGTAGAQTRQLPIEFFLDLLGPNAVHFWSDPANGNLIAIDAYNKRNVSLNIGLPTTVTGKVMIQSLRDGTERVTVSAHTKNAVCWGFAPSSPTTNVPAFGYSPLQVKNNIGPASLGETSYRIVYAPQPAGMFNPNGAGVVLEAFMATVNCDGLLRAGSGFPEGTPGFAHTRQTGLYDTGANAGAGCPPEQDANCFPSEKVEFKPRGN